MHGELCESQIGGEDSRVAEGYGAERSAAPHVGTIEKGLVSDSRLIEYRLDDGGRERVRGIRLIRVILNDDSAAHCRSIRRIALFGMIGVHGVRVIERNEKRRGQGFIIFVVVEF